LCNAYWIKLAQKIGLALGYTGPARKQKDERREDKKGGRKKE
jgi:hypothetical protein